MRMQTPGQTSGDRNREVRIWKDQKRPASKGAAVGTEAVPGNEGVGEHVRTRFQSGFGPGEIAEQRLRTERRKPVSSAGPVLGKRTRPKVDPAVWPDVSPTPSFVDQSLSISDPLREANRLEARVTCRHQAAGNSWRSEVTSSSWRPCGSSSQSSSLRSSPSLPS